MSLELMKSILTNAYLDENMGEVAQANIRLVLEMIEKIIKHDEKANQLKFIEKEKE